MHQVCIRMPQRQCLELSITSHCSIIQSSAQLCNPWCAAVWNPHHLNSATHNPARSRRVLHRLSLSPASLISFHRVLSPSRIVGTLITTSCDVSVVAPPFLLFSCYFFFLFFSLALVVLKNFEKFLIYLRADVGFIKTSPREDMGGHASLVQKTRPWEFGEKSNLFCICCNCIQLR